MQTILIDTQVILWWFSSAEKLSQNHKDMLADQSIEVVISIASLIEISIKKSIGKLKVEFDLEKAILESQMKILNITFDHLEVFELLPYYHRDPFDRLIISQSKVEDRPIMTYDDIFSKYNVQLM